MRLVHRLGLAVPLGITIIVMLGCNHGGGDTAVRRSAVTDTTAPVLTLYRPESAATLPQRTYGPPLPERAADPALVARQQRYLEMLKVKVGEWRAQGRSWEEIELLEAELSRAELGY